MSVSKEYEPIVITLDGVQRKEAIMYPMECQNYDRLLNAGRGYMYISLEGSGIGLMDWHGRLILNLAWDAVHPYFDDGVIIAEKGNTQVLFDFEGKTVTGLPIEALLDGKAGAAVFDKNGSLMHVDAVGDFSNGMARAMIGRRVGYVNSKGVYVLDAPYEKCGDFHDQRAVFEKKNGFFKPKTYGYIEQSGSVVIQPVFKAAGNYSEGFAVVHTDKGWRHIDMVGTQLEYFCLADNGSKKTLPPTAMAEDFANGYARVLMTDSSSMIAGGDGTFEIMSDGSGGWGLIDKTGRLTVPTKYDLLSDANDNGICIFRERGTGKLGLISAQGEVLQDAYYESIDPLRGGIFALKQAEFMWRVADADGRLIGTRTWSRIGRLAADGICVHNGEKWGIVSYSGDDIMPFRYDMDFCLQNGAALVKRDGEFKICDRYGRELNQIRFEDAGNLYIGLGIVRCNGKACLLDYGFDQNKETY